MSSKPFLLVAVGVLVCTAGCPKGTTSAETTTGLTQVADAESHLFPVLGGFQHLCGQSVLGQDGTEIVWDLFWSAEAPADVARLYTEQLGTAGLEQADGEWTWRVPAEGIPDRVLNVMPTDRPHPQCETAVPAGAATVGVFSEMFRRTAPTPPEPPAPTPSP